MKKQTLLFFATIVLSLLAVASSRAETDSFSQEGGVTPHLIAAVDSIKPGKFFDLSLVLSLQPGWHTYGKDPGSSGFPPSIKWDLPQGWSAGGLEFSPPQRVLGPDGTYFQGYEKEAVIRIPITPPANLDLSQSWKLNAHVFWLACSSTECVPGSAILSVVVGGDAQKQHSSQSFVFKSWKNLRVLLLALASGLLGGFILNLMPCVLPVISLKVFGFIRQAGESRSKIWRHGLAFVAGIYLWFITLGLLIVALKASGMEITWAFQFQNSTFLLVLSILVFLFALNLFGVFEVALPSKASSSLDKISSQNGYLGSFFQGLFATLLATPCTAPFLGSALGFAFAQSGSVIMAMFVAIATGMAFPYIALSAKPGWMQFLPRPGSWMERIKQLMGFPLLATNLWLLSVLGTVRGMGEVMMMLVLLLLLGLSAWIYGSFFTSKKTVRFVAMSLSLFLAGASCWYLIPKILLTSKSSYHQLSEVTSDPIIGDKINWVPYSAARLEELRSAGRAVFIDFTAAWCLTCQFNERTAINTAAVRKLLQEQDIIPMKADWTSANPEITEALRAFGRVGVPFYVFYPASTSREKATPVTFSELLTESQLIKVLTQHSL